MSIAGALRQLIRSKITLTLLIVGALTAGIYFVAGKSVAKKRQKINPAFASYISAYTSGAISRESGIRIQLAGNFADSSKIGSETKVFSFDPEIKGKSRWIDATTIEFKPDEPLPSGQEYEATFLLENIIDVSKELEEFPFHFSVIRQSFEVSYPSFEAIDKTKLVYQRVSGTLETADTEDDSKIEKLLTVIQDGKEFHVKWEHAADKRNHRYYADSVLRKTTASEVTVKWDGSPLDLDLKGEHKITIPALGDFKVMNATVVNDGDQYINIYFSDPILPSQDLNGLITLNSTENQATVSDNSMRFTIDGHYVKCYPAVTLTGINRLNIFPGIQNILGYKLKNSFIYDLDFADVLPSVKFIGKGVIMPSGNKIRLPFEAVSLNAVDVTVIKIYENNISQFLQVNNLDGSNELVRVGRPMVKKTIRLDKDKLVDLRKTNTFNLDLDELIRTEPGALYQVKIAFKKAYSLYRCEASENQEEQSTDSEMEKLDNENWDGEAVEADQSFWDYAEEDYDYSNYNWNERDNPCSNSYYNYSRVVTRNIMASDLGIIAKKGTGNELLFAVTNILSTEPMSGVTIDILDYQQQLITSGTTNNDGMVKIPFTRKPFLAIARYKEQRGYLKLDDGTALSVSQFDVTGEVVQKGIKGFLYGERGVWRPGDSLYLTFILEDKSASLPKGHPVTLELYNPLGALYKRLVSSNSLNGFYDFRTCTDMEAPTGSWTAKVKVGGTTFSKSIRIETVMPNRLKIELNFPKPYITKGIEVQTTLRSKWLHGAIADGLDAKVEMTLTKGTTTFARFPDYIFDNPTKKFTPETNTIFEGKLNGNGEAFISVNPELESEAGGMLNANFVTKVFEPGGNFSTDRFQIPFHPYNSYVGLRLPKGDVARGMLLTDTNHYVSIVCVQPDGNLKRGTRKATVRLYKIQWRWWWDRSDDDLGNYANSEEYSALMEEEVTLTNGMGKCMFRVNYPDWGRYLMTVTDEEGHSSGKAFYMDWPGWAGRAQREGSLEATILNFNLNKSTYQVGEKATLTLPTPQAGRALLSIENGSGVVESHWIVAQKGQTSYSFTITKEMLPNVYAHVTLVQPHGQVENDLPIRLYGMSAIKVEDPSTILKPVIGMANQIKPDIQNNITISEATGKPMTYTLAIVDEGLLDLTRFKTPDPHSSFYAREALGVKTWDMYDFVMGAFGTQFNRLVSIGGDEGINKKADANKAKRFKPAVKFIGPFHLPAGQKQIHALAIENYIGSVRVMVIAGYDGAYGFAEKAVPVKKPLMVLATLPRVLRPTEEVQLPVTVFAIENFVKNVTIQVSGNNLVEFPGGKTKTLRFAKPGDEVVNFDLKVKRGLGIAKVHVVASSGGESSTYDVELDVSNPNPYENLVYEGNLETGRTWETKYSLPGMAGTNSATLEVSGIPPINLENRLRYLVQYPHGCVEQTTSSVFPQVALNNLLDLHEGWKKEIQRNINAGISRLRLFQTSTGGFAYWPGEGEADNWASSYAGHFLTEAINFGYSVPNSLYNNWKNFQKSKASSWIRSGNPWEDEIQAYRLYTLALAKSPETGAMNRLKEVKDLSSNAKWRLAAAFALTGNTAVGKELIARERTEAPVINDNNYYDYTYGSAQRDEAMILETLVLLGEKTKASYILKKVCNNLAGQMYMSTQSTAYSLLAVAALTGKFKDNRVLEFDYTVNGKTMHYRGNTTMVQLSVPVNGEQGGKINVSNKTGQLMYTRLITRGQPAIGNQTASQENLDMTVVWRTMDGAPLNPASITQGTDFKVEVTVSNPGQLGNYSNMALNMILPSGWEIHNTRLNNTATDPAYSTPRYQDIRDDRVYTYFDLGPKNKVTYVFLLNASYLGKFYLPGFSCESMYKGQIQARQTGMWVQVIPKKQISAPVEATK